VPPVNLLIMWSEVVVVARREWRVITRLVRLSLVVRGNSLTDVAVTARKKPNALAVKTGLARASLLHSSAALPLLSGVLNRLGASADIGVTRWVEPHTLTTEPVIARASLFNSPAALVFAASLLFVVNARSGRVGPVPVDLAVKTVIAEVVVTRLAEGSRLRGAVAKVRAGASKVVKGVGASKVFPRVVPRLIVPLASAGGVTLERRVRYRVTPVGLRFQAAVAGVGAVSAPLPEAAAVAGLFDASAGPV